MKPYNANGVCPKCGSAHVTTRFYAAIGNVGTEHIRRECSRCRYEWREAPLDARINPDRSQVAALSMTMTPLCPNCHGDCCVNKRGSVVAHGSVLALHSCPDC